MTEEIWLELTRVTYDNEKLRKTRRMLEWDSIMFLDDISPSHKYRKARITTNSGHSFDVEETIEDILGRIESTKNYHIGFKGDDNK